MKLGTHLGPFEIVAPLGAGGMGEVYRARDPRLGREVAIKVLPAEVANDAERLRRFEQEARAASALNHANILTLHDLGFEDGKPYLVMELLEGRSLREVLASDDMLPTRKALDWGVQIARGLAAAHGNGIVHRDLKPENLFACADGRIKILDFGLAKLATPEEGGSSPAEATTLAELTQSGVVLGTAGYMAPEQVRGERVDARADLFALGCVLYELLTDSRVFHRQSPADSLSAILRDEPPPFTAVAPERHLPPVLEAVVRRCLEKDPADRFGSARDLAFALEALASESDARLEPEEGRPEPSLPAVETAAPVPAPYAIRRALPGVVAGALLGVLIGVTATAWITRGGGKVAPRPSKAHLSVDLIEGTTLYLYENPAMAVSPDGQTLAWIANGSDGLQRLYVRAIDQPTAKLIQGSENAYGPFFSPDGRWIAYFDQAEAQLEKITIGGGVPTKVCDAPKSSKGGTWGDRGEIVFSYGYDGGLARVSADGGAIEMLTEPDRNAGVKTHRFPHLLPGGRAVLFMIGDAEIATFNESRIAALNLDTGERKILVEGGMSPRYAASGHLVFARQGTLLAAPFDAERLEMLGPPTPVFEGLVTNDGWGFGEYALAPNGTLLFAPGGPDAYSRRLVQADRTGRVGALSIPERVFANGFDFSPDGRKLAVTVTGANFDVWLWDRERQILSRLTAGWNNADPLWSPDGKKLIFQTDRRAAGASDFFWVAADGSSPAEPLYETLRVAWPSSWSPDGRHLAYYELDPETDYDIWILPIAEGMKPGPPEKLVGSNAREMWPSFSPDNLWLAYASDETGAEEIYIRPFPGPGAKQQVSSGGGIRPQWGPRGDEIFYVDPISGRMMSASVTTVPELSVGAPEALFDFESTSTAFRLSPDGEHFVFLQGGSQAEPIRQLRIVFNWFDELDRVFAETAGR